jgi:hypothetical protein
MHKGEKSQATSTKQKFFGSFLQKRTASLDVALNARKLRNFTMNQSKVVNVVLPGSALLLRY